MSAQVFQVGQEVLYRADRYSSRWNKMPVLRIGGRSYVLAHKWNEHWPPTLIKVSFKKAHTEPLCLSELDQIEYQKAKERKVLDQQFCYEWKEKVVHEIRYGKVGRETLEKIMRLVDVGLSGMDPETDRASSPKTSVEAKKAGAKGSR